MSFWNPWGRVKRLKAELAVARHMIEAERQLSLDMTLALLSIVACDTPGANATVKRCVRIAKGALEE